MKRFLKLKKMTSICSNLKREMLLSKISGIFEL